jgi:hypothetical protein
MAPRLLGGRGIFNNTNMHDEFTVVKRFKLFTIWHRDPETDGTDDSCGWTYPTISDAHRVRLNKEMKFDRDQVLNTYRNWSDRYRMHLIYTTYRHIKWVLFMEHLTAKDIIKINSCCYNYVDDLKIHVSDQDWENQLEFERFFWCITRHVLHARRKWYQHPRWHVSHWRLQIHFLGYCSDILFK